VVELHLLQRAPPVVDTVVDAEHFEVLFQQADGRQDTVAVQAIRVITDCP